MRKESKARLILRWVILVVFVVVTAFPFYYAVLNSFRSLRDVSDLSYAPTGLTLDNWIKAFSEGSKVPRWLFNSLLVTFSITTLSTTIDTLAGYTFARKRFPGSNVLFLLVLSGLAIPSGMLVIPVFVLMTRLQLVNTYWALILPAASVLGTFMMRQSIRTLPIELDEAARLDGGSDLQILWHVIVPLVRPALASVFIVLFLTHWNSFIYPLVVTNKTDMRTLTVGLYLLYPDWRSVMVISTLMIASVLIVFIFLQRHFIRGFALAGFRQK